MKLTKKLLAMALAGVMLLTILTGCSGGKTGDRLVEEYMATFISEHSGDIPTTHDVPEIKTVADMFETSETSWLNDDGSWNITSGKDSNDPKYIALKDVFNKYASGYTVTLVAFEVDSTQSELDQAMRVMTSSLLSGLQVYGPGVKTTATKCATRLVTRGDKSYRIAVIIYDHHAVAVG